MDSDFLADSYPEVLTPQDLARLLKRSVKTIVVDASRRANSLPPRLKIPGSKKLLWLRPDCAKWLRAMSTAGTGEA